MKLASQGHSLSVGCRARVLSDRKEKDSKQGALTPCRVQRECEFRTAIYSQQNEGHSWLVGPRGSHQDIEIKPAREEYSRSVGRRGRDSSGQQRKVSEQGGSQPVECRGRDMSGQSRKARYRVVHMSCWMQKQGHVKTA
jgi:hypothetical protein